MTFVAKVVRARRGTRPASSSRTARPSSSTVVDGGRVRPRAPPPDGHGGPRRGPEGGARAQGARPRPRRRAQAGQAPRSSRRSARSTPPPASPGSPPSCARPPTSRTRPPTTSSPSPTWWASSTPTARGATGAYSILEMAVKARESGLRAGSPSATTAAAATYAHGLDPERVRRAVGRGRRAQRLGRGRHPDPQGDRDRHPPRRLPRPARRPPRGVRRRDRQRPLRVPPARGGHDRAARARREQPLISTSSGTRRGACCSGARATRSTSTACSTRAPRTARPSSSTRTRTASTSTRRRSRRRRAGASPSRSTPTPTACTGIEDVIFGVGAARRARRAPRRGADGPRRSTPSAPGARSGAGCPPPPPFIVRTPGPRGVPVNDGEATREPLPEKPRAAAQAHGKAAAAAADASTPRRARGRSGRSSSCTETYPDARVRAPPQERRSSS